jgi:hypothetical protein
VQRCRCHISWNTSRVYLRHFPEPLDLLPYIERRRMLSSAGPPVTHPRTSLAARAARREGVTAVACASGGPPAAAALRTANICLFIARLTGTMTRRRPVDGPKAEISRRCRVYWIYGIPLLDTRILVCVYLCRYELGICGWSY